jgi:hypothetical protein
MTFSLNGFPLCLFLSSFRNDGTEFGGSIYQKVSDTLETSVNLAWTAGSNSTRFGIAAKYQLDKDATLSVSHCRYFCQALICMMVLWS